MNAGSKVSIPASVQNTIKDLKEITGSHSEEEIYAMLKDCSMDPNETAQKLLLQDTFHEVRRKRDKRKENIVSREPAEPRIRYGIPGRGNRGGRGNYSPRFTPHDVGVARNTAHGKQNGTHQASEKVVSSGSLFYREAHSKEVPPIEGILNGPCESDFGTSSKTNASHSSTRRDFKQPEVTLFHDSNKVGGSEVNTYSMSMNKRITSTVIPGGGDKNSQLVHISRYSSNSAAFTSNPVRSNDPWPSGSGGAMQPEFEIPRNSNDHVPVLPNVNKLTSGSSLMSGKLSARFGVGVKGQVTESSLSMPPVAYGNNTSNRLPGYSNRSQHATGTPKVASKEWKPKPLNPRPIQMPETAGASNIPITSKETDIHSTTESVVPTVELEVKCVQEKLKDVLIGDQRPEKQHVIIPDHLHVPESERNKLSFGSIDAWFTVGTSNTDGPESTISSTPLSEASLEIEETVERPSSSNQNSISIVDNGDHHSDTQSLKHEDENLSSIEADITPSIVPEDEPKQETSLPAGSHQYSMVQTSPGYNFGFTPPVLGSHIPSFENTDPQARDMTRLPSFVVPQPVDPSTYYAQLYRSNIENDGRISPFHLSGVSSKYNNNAAMLSTHPPEGGTGAALVTQAAGVMQSSISLPQQPVPVLRQPTGLHVSHYQHNYIPYGHYFSPFYFPSPGIHQFLNNGAFPQQPQPGNLYPTPGASVTGVKYALSQYKPGANMGNSAVGMMGGYSPFGSAVTYNPTSVSATANSVSNEDLSSSQFKESGVYSSGQQNEGSGMWIAAPGREMAGMQSNSFYNIPPQGQHVTYAPTQGGHAAFSSIYHPSQGVPTPHQLLQQQQQHAQTIPGVAEIGGGGGTSGIFQQPQHTQMNWPNSY